jgi:hypothetical protein
MYLLLPDWPTTAARITKSPNVVAVQKEIISIKDVIAY